MQTYNKSIKSDNLQLIYKIIHTTYKKSIKTYNPLQEIYNPSLQVVYPPLTLTHHDDDDDNDDDHDDDDDGWMVGAEGGGEEEIGSTVKIVPQARGSREELMDTEYQGIFSKTQN